MNVQPRQRLLSVISLLSLILPLVLSLFVLAPPSVAAAGPQYHIEDLTPDLIGSSAAYAINDAGVIAGEYTGPGSTVHAFRWANGVFTDLNGSWYDSRARGIDAAGTIVGDGCALESDDNYYPCAVRGFRYNDASGFQEIVGQPVPEQPIPLGAPAAAVENGVAVGLLTSGHVTFGGYTTGAGGTVATRIPRASGCAINGTLLVNANVIKGGRVFGYGASYEGPGGAGGCVSYSPPVAYSPSEGYIVFGQGLPDSERRKLDTGTPLGANSMGQVVGAASCATVSATAPFYYDINTNQFICLTRSATSYYSTAYGINDSGVIVGDDGGLGGDTHTALLYRVSRDSQGQLVEDPANPVNLLDVIDSRYSDGQTAGWRFLSTARAVNASGVIVGTGQHCLTAVGSCYTHAFKLTPLGQDTTAPTTGAVVAPAANGGGYITSSPATVTLAATDNAGGAGVKQIDYLVNGAATTVNGASATITLSDQGTFAISYRAVDNADNAESYHTLTVTIDSVAPTLTLGVGASTVQPGQTVSLSTSGSDILATPPTVALTGSCLPGGSASVQLNSSGDMTNTGGYAIPASVTQGCTVTAVATATDAAGNVGTSNSASFAIEVPAGQPMLAITSDPANEREGSPIALTATITPAGSYGYAWTVTKNGQPFASGGGQTFTFTPDDNGRYVATVVATPGGGGGVSTSVGSFALTLASGQLTGSKTLTVANVAPSAAFTAPAMVLPGQPIALSLDTPTDPSTVDTSAGFQYAFACGSESYGAYSATGTATCTAPLVGPTVAVHGRIKDKDNGVRTYSKTVRVDGAPPTTTATVAPKPNANGWNRANVTVTLTAKDNAGGVGIRQIDYSATGAQSLAATTVGGNKATIQITVEGSTTLTFHATDNLANAEADQTLVVRLDKTAPTLTVPQNSDPRVADLIVAATGPSGAAVTYTASASDNLDGSPVVVCTQPSGGQFAIGQTNVRCTATDQAGNAVAKTFTVKVLGAKEQVQQLRADVVVALGTPNSLTAALDKTVAAINQGQPQAGCAFLDSFIAGVNGQTGLPLTAQQRARFVADAQRIKAVLGCGSVGGTA